MAILDMITAFCYITAACVTRDMQDRRPVGTASVTRQAVPTPLGLSGTPSPIGSVPSIVPGTVAPPGRLVPLPLSANPSPNIRTPPVSVNSNTVSAPEKKPVRETSPYPTRYDYIDVESVMNNERILKVLFNCVMNKGPCTREGLELKRIIPDALQTECAKCSDRQKKQAGKVLAHLLHYKPDYWKMLVEKFDPNNVYLKKYLVDDDDEINNTTAIVPIKAKT